MIKKTLASVGLVAAAMAAGVTPAMAIGDSDGSGASVQGNGGTNATGTWGNHSPNFHFLDNPNICLPEIHHVQVGLVPIQADIPVGNQQLHQVCNVGQPTQANGDGAVSHLIG
ncbi:rodlet layer protein [Kitasatospora sp. NBC_01266]|uniref:rodlet layer protein n=1 Tax=Kitasatospora sp. NBC_01266 TaxID=2903572 RepID=UPI002E35B170|nr:rodlet layer protein [Kitasatospora sp. NBC_01266]